MTNADVATLIRDTASGKLARQYAAGVGQDLRARTVKGAPVRVTPSEVLTAVKDALQAGGFRVSLDLQTVESVLRSAGFSSSRHGNKLFFTLAQEAI